jgi:hypothetical protein
MKTTVLTPSVTEVFSRFLIRHYPKTHRTLLVRPYRKGNRDRYEIEVYNSLDGITDVHRINACSLADVIESLTSKIWAHTYTVTYL